MINQDLLKSGAGGHLVNFYCFSMNVIVLPTVPTVGEQFSEM
mgnify:CR=1 FL=1